MHKAGQEFASYFYFAILLEKNRETVPKGPWTGKGSRSGTLSTTRKLLSWRPRREALALRLVDAYVEKTNKTTGSPKKFQPTSPIEYSTRESLRTPCKGRRSSHGDSHAGWAADLAKFS